MGRHRLGKAFIHPTAPLQGSFDRAVTGLKALLAHVVHQHSRAPARFKVAIVTWMLDQHGLQDRQSRLFLAVGAANRWAVLEPVDSVLEVGLKPTAIGVFVTTHGLGNSRYLLPSSREQDR
jgi:hypothetical protein